MDRTVSKCEVEAGADEVHSHVVDLHTVLSCMCNNHYYYTESCCDERCMVHTAVCLLLNTAVSVAPI